MPFDTLFVENGNTVTVTVLDESAATIVFERTEENTLTVKSVSQHFKDVIDDIPLGTKLLYSAK